MQNISATWKRSPTLKKRIKCPNLPNTYPIRLVFDWATLEHDLYLSWWLPDVTFEYGAPRFYWIWNRLCKLKGQKGMCGPKLLHHNKSNPINTDPCSGQSTTTPITSIKSTAQKKYNNFFFSLKIVTKKHPSKKGDQSDVHLNLS